MVRGRFALLAFAAALGSAAARAQDCRAELLPGKQPAGAESKAVAPLDLARLRDFGKQDVGLGGEPPFSISPDGRLAAMVLRRGDPARDSYCIGVAIIPLDGGQARLVDAGGEFILRLSDVRGIPDLPIGNAEPVTPRWSPDGRWLAYLRRDRGRTRVWIASADGSGARPLSDPGQDARAVRWSADGRSLLVTTRPGVISGEVAVDAQGRHGFLYDARFWTLSRARPAPPLPLPLVERAMDARNGRDLGEPDGPRAGDPEKPKGALAFARSSSGAIAWTSARDPQILLGPVMLQVALGGRTVLCHSPYCRDGLGEVWWGEGDELFFLQGATPANGGVTSLLRWRVGRDPEPTLMLSTIDALFGCQHAGSGIICARETATQPRHLVRIGSRSGGPRVIFDPNPEFRPLLKGEVRRLRWDLGQGVGSFGDLVLPPGHRPGERRPLIVVQYQSRGFLRGGTGDEYPIQALAARGFAVLSVERTRPVGAGVARSSAELVRMATSGFAERRRVLDSVEAGIRKAIALGVVDPQRIGITGLSDGAATVQYALVNSRLFRAAAISSCCDEPSTSMFAAGPGYAELLIQAGFPPPGTDGSAFWRHYSLAANARRIRAPILLQLTDDEFRLSLETFATLKQAGVPIEMYVFPGEYHQKWRPAHRLAVYERAIDWFDFWLNGRTEGPPGRHAQFARWRELARLAQER